MANYKCLGCSKEFYCRSRGKYKPKYCSKECHYKNVKFKVIEGSRCNMLLLLREIEPKIIYSNGNNVAIRWVECKCDCGNICKIELSKFKNKKQKSCGCYKSPPLQIAHMGNQKQHYIRYGIVCGKDVKIKT